MNVSVIDPVQDKRWNTFVNKHKYGSIFHSSEWGEILNKTFSYEPYYLVLEDGNDIRAGIPFMKINSLLTGHRLISLPRTSYSDPLVENKEELALLLQKARETVDDHGLNFFEIKTQNNARLFDDSGLHFYDHFHNQIIDLEPGSDKLWNNLHRSCVKQRIMKAQKANVTVRIGDSLRDLETFYALYKMTATKHLIPPRPFDFFKNIWTAFNDNKVVLFLAERERKVGAAALFLRSRDSLIFEFNCVDDTMTDHSPGHVIIWEAIQMACNEGLNFFDFGITSPDNIGLMNFKTRWGGIDTTLRSFYYPDVSGYKSFLKNIPTSGAKCVPITLLNRKVKAYIAEKLFRHLG